MGRLGTHQDASPHHLAVTQRQIQKNLCTYLCVLRVSVVFLFKEADCAFGLLEDGADRGKRRPVVAVCKGLGRKGRQVICHGVFRFVVFGAIV